MAVFSYKALGQSFSVYFEKASAKSEKINEARANLELAQAQKRSAFAEIYPQLSASAQKSYASDEVERTKEGTLVSVGAEQVLFKGLAEFRALSAAELNLQAAHAQLAEQKNSVAVDVLSAMSATTASRYKLKLFEDYSEILDRRHKELKNRSRIGKSRDVDVLQTELEKLKLERQKNQAEVDQANSLATLASLVGEKVDEEAVPRLTAIIEELKTVSFPSRAAGLESRRLTLESKEKEISAQRGSYFPTLSAYGNYYPYARDAFKGTEDTWDAGLKLNWVLFSGFSSTSAVEKTQAQAEALRASYADFERNLRLQQTDQLLARGQLEAQLASLERSLEIQERAYGQQERDYRLGVVTSLEVLTSLQQGLDLKVDVLELRKTLIENYAKSFSLGTEKI